MLSVVSAGEDTGSQSIPQDHCGFDQTYQVAIQAIQTGFEQTVSIIFHREAETQSFVIATLKSRLYDCQEMDFEIVGDITDIETIAIGTSIRDRARLRKVYGKGRWRKLKGVAKVRLTDGTIRLAELHWYEAHSIGKREFKLKLPFLD